MNKPPAFQFYPKDFLADINVSIMTMEERGVYITLLCHLWNEGRLPRDSKMLQRLCGYPPNQDGKWGEIWAAVGCCFYAKKDHLFHKRLDQEKTKQNEWREKSSLGGYESAKKRWGFTPEKNKGGYKMVTRVVQPKGNSSVFSLQSSSSKDKDKDKEPPYIYPPIEDIKSKWNTFAEGNNLSQIINIKGNRLISLRSRLKEKEFDFNGILEMIPKCPLLLGESGKGWTVTFDWILKPSNYIKILEGAYLKRGLQEQTKGRTGVLQRWADKQEKGT